MKRSILLSANLKKLLLQKNLSLHQLSRRTNINKSTLHNYLNGVQPQGLSALLKLSAFFDIPIDQLLFNQESTAIFKKQTSIELTEGHFEVIIRKVEQKAR